MVLAGLLFAGTGVAQSLAALEQVHAQAMSARTTNEHAAVARQYRQHAESLAAKAAEHENNVKQLMRASGASVIKWPGMASGQLQKEKAKAVETRRAANEAKGLADKHIRLAVEAQAGPVSAVNAD